MKNNEVVRLNDKVFIYYSCKGLVLRLPTGIEWKSRNQEENKTIIDTYVKSLREIVSSYIKENGCKPSRDYVKSKLKSETPSEKSNLIDYVEEFLSAKRADIVNGNLKQASLTDFTSLKGALIDFEKKSETTFKLTDISEDFVSRFVTYLQTTRKLNIDSCKKRLNSFKAFLNFCEEKKYFTMGFDWESVKPE